MTELNNLIDNISNIKNDITNALVQKNASFTDFASYPGAIENIKTGGGVYQYDSLENMYADIPNRSNGDIGVVYSNTMNNLTENITFQEVLFPREVVLNSKPTRSRSIQFRVNPTTEAMIEGLKGAFSRYEFYLDGHGTFYNYDIEYITNNGLTYTLNTVIRGKRVNSDTIAIFDKPLKFYSSGSSSTNWVDDLGKFMKVRNITFDGIFRYDGTNFTLINTQLNANLESVYNGIFYGQYGKQEGNIVNTNLNLAQLKTRVNLYGNLSNLNLENSQNCSRLFYNLRNIVNVPYINTVDAIDTSYMFSMCSNLINIPYINTMNAVDTSYMFAYCNNLINVPTYNTINVINMDGMFEYCNSLSNTSIQNIINMCLNSNITNISYMNLNNTNSYSPLYNTKFDSSYYSNRLDELTAAGWTY